MQTYIISFHDSKSKQFFLDMSIYGGLEIVSDNTSVILNLSSEQYNLLNSKDHKNRFGIYQIVEGAVNI